MRGHEAARDSVDDDATRPPRVAIRSSCATLASRLADSAAAAGWSHDSLVGDVVVSSTPPDEQARESSAPWIFVCSETPFAAKQAVSDVMGLRVTSIVAAPDELGLALASTLSGNSWISQRVLKLAQLMPALTHRQIDLITDVTAGRSNADIGREMYLSVASIKRELGIIYERVGLHTRKDLIEYANVLGIDSDSRRHAEAGQLAAASDI